MSVYESYPPGPATGDKKWNSGTGVADPITPTPPASAWTGGVDDMSALFATVTGVDPASIADRPTLLTDATVGTAAMTAAYAGDSFPTDAYIQLGDNDWVSWNGTAWEDGPTPPPPPAPGDWNPGDYTVDEVKDYIDALVGTPEWIATETQRVLDAERSGENRSTLVSWLDQRLGVE